MNSNVLRGKQFLEMIEIAAIHLSNNKEHIDALNVFPVPDGDTGTNMNLSMTVGLKEVRLSNVESISDIATIFAKGLLMGARGNSGVILSQVFRGFAKGLAGVDVATTEDLANAMQQGATTAYSAVVEPVEGTILTVIREGAEFAKQEANREQAIVPFMENLIDALQQSLLNTPELLPVLKEVGVVDSGGQGLVIIFEGFLKSLKGEALPTEPIQLASIDSIVTVEHKKLAQSHMSAEDIKYGYCTEFMVKFDEKLLENSPYDEENFRNELQDRGDSLVVVSDEDVVKVHVHTEYPGAAMTLAQKYGSLINIKVENMREQHSNIIKNEAANTVIENKGVKIPYAILAISMGGGIGELLKSLGADSVLEGGQTMNPSAQDIKEAMEELNAERIIILPNNKNILMAANLAADLSEKVVTVIPSVSIPQGMSALLAFNPEKDIKANEEAMTVQMHHVKTGQVTYATRNTTLNGLTIKKNQFIGLSDGEICQQADDPKKAAEKLIDSMLTDDDEILTILYGADVTKVEAQVLLESIEANHPELEVELHDGGQPIYSYIFAIE